MQRKVEPVVSNTAPNIRSNIRAMLKMMIGDKDRWTEQVIPLRREELGKDMQDQEGHIIDAIRYCYDQRIPPTKDTIIMHLEMHRRINVESPREYVDALMEEFKDDTMGIRTLSGFVNEWIKERRLESAMNVGIGIANDAYLGYDDKWEAVNKVLQDVSPNDSFLYEEMSELEFRQITFEKNQRIIQLRKEGKDIGPNFPFEAVRAWVPYLQWGEVTLITGPKGTGKTTIAQTFSENVAWHQRLDTDVVYIGLETPIEVLSQRQFCRYSFIPYKAIDEGSIDLSTGKWKVIWDNWEAAAKNKASSSGYVRYSYAPGATVFDVISLMNRASETSLLLGRKVVFIVDHLHSINWAATHKEEGEFGARRAIFELLAAAANRLSIRNPNHLVVFAQEGGEKGMVFGGTFQKNRAQYVFSLGRENWGMNGNEPAVAQDNLLITYPIGKIPKAKFASGEAVIDKKDPLNAILLDATGNWRYWYRKGDKQSHRGNMRMIWANDNALGNVLLMFESAFSRVQGDPDQVADLRKEGLLVPVGVK